MKPLAGKALSTVQNLRSILQERWDDFQRQSRFFKYRVAVVAGFGAMTVLTLALTCPSSELDANNRLGARLVVAGSAREPIFMLVNDSAEPWLDIMVIANGTFRAALPRIEAKESFTLTPKQLMGPNGGLAPADLQLSELELRTSGGRVMLSVERP